MTIIILHDWRTTIKAASRLIASRPWGVEVGGGRGLAELSRGGQSSPRLLYFHAASPFITCSTAGWLAAAV